MDLYSVSFNGFQLNDLSYTEGVMWHDFDRMPDANRSVSVVTSANRSVATNVRWVQKTARITILTMGCPKNVLDAHIARIRQVLQSKGQLVLKKGVPVLVSGVYDYSQFKTITYTDAILSDVSFDSDGATSVVNIDVILLDPIAKGDTKQTLATGTKTTSTTSIDLSSTDIQGTFNNQFPVYTFIINSITNGATPSLSVYNGFNTLEINKSFSASDIILVDTESMTVTLNGDLIDFNGVFPNIQNNSQPLQLIDTFSARNISYNIEITPRYI